jgi:hypothetical protein
MHAKLVEAAHNDAEENRRARHFGINGLSPLSRLSSLDFPASFPHDFMHAMFENVVPMLIDLWTHSRKFVAFGTGDEDYVLGSDIWKDIGAACAQSGGTIPAVFGCRVPNPALERSQTTAESTLLFATLLAPALLRNCFKNRRYYDHFITLVQLIDTCMALELCETELRTLREGFADWVMEFERYVIIHGICTCMTELTNFINVADITDTLLTACVCARS